MRSKRLICFAFVLVFLFSLAASASADNGNTTVYITKTGECYHRGNCSYLSSSKISISLADAVAAGYRPCSKCKPPSLSGASSNTETRSATYAQSYSSSSQTRSQSSGSPIGFMAAGAALFGGGYALASRKRRK